MSVVHRDIKPGNILVRKIELGMKLEVSICDFGFADFVVGSQRCDYQAGTIGFVAPELLKYQMPTFKSDIFSLGATIYLLLVGKNLFNGGPNEASYL